MAGDLGLTELAVLAALDGAKRERPPWRVDAHPRLAADMTGDRHADVLAFGAGGVYVSAL